jgi:hypothetical protein
MIFEPAFNIGVKNWWILGPDGFKVAEWGMFPNTFDPSKKDIKRYFAESHSILLMERNTQIDIVVGSEVSDAVLQNTMGYAIKQGKPLFLKRCESLENLRVSDHTVQMTNEFLKAFPKITSDDESDT